MKMRYTFTSLFNSPISLGEADKKCVISKVVIPRIQRPYAQGRTDDESKKVREKFLNEIFNVLNGESDGLDLNFVYGKVDAAKNGKDENKMELLDGQQRFTTLYLMHWYLIVREREQITSEDDVKAILTALRSFEYETRKTSTAFCKVLSKLAAPKSGFTFSQNDMDGKPCYISPGVAIKSSLEYVHSFESDPTVDAMLTMLDAIHESYNQSGIHGEAWKNLQKISFCVLSLTEYKLSEELYIKMNARGLSLSPFDCFKSDFLNLEFPARKVDIHSGEVANEGDNNAVSFKQYFATKLDCEWCNLFWDSNYPTHLSESYMLFFSRYFAVRYILENPDEIAAAKEWRDRRKASDLYVLRDDYEKDRKHYHGIRPFERLVTSASGRRVGYFDDLDVIFTLLMDSKRKNEMLRAIVPLWEGDVNEDKQLATFDFLCNWVPDRLADPKLVLLSAVISFLHYFSECPMAIFRAWMKAVNCIVENTDINTVDITARTSRHLDVLISKIANECPATEFEFYCSMSKMSKNDFDQAAIKEEIDKAIRIAENESAAQGWISLFDKVMRHPFLKGTIGFYYSENMTFEEFSRHFKLIDSMFDRNGISADYRGGEFLLLRAIMSQITSWGELNDKYITDRHEGDKRLKNLLVSNQQKELQGRIKALFSSWIFNNASKNATCDNIKQKIDEALTSAIENAPAIAKNTDWETREALSVLRGNVNFYNWVTSKKSPVHVYHHQNQIQARVPNKWSCVMMSVFHLARSLADEFEMKKVVEESEKRGGFSPPLDMFIGQECVLQKSLDGCPDITLEVRFHADYQRATPVDICVKWEVGKIDNGVEDSIVEKIKVLQVGNVTELEIKTVNDQKKIDIGSWSFSPGDDNSHIDFKRLRDKIKELLGMGFSDVKKS